MHFSALAAGNVPTIICLDQSEMREHLLSCLESDGFKSFPQLPKPRPKKTNAIRQLATTFRDKS
jgi:hypothetical protein